jgi:hypothetical protein
LDVAFGKRSPVLADTVPEWKQLGDKELDPSQRSAVDLVLAAKDFALIHGPPGMPSALLSMAIIPLCWLYYFSIVFMAGPNNSSFNSESRNIARHSTLCVLLQLCR